MWDSDSRGVCGLDGRSLLKRSFLTALFLVLGASPVWAENPTWSYPRDPRATFLTASSAHAPLVIKLSDLGIAPGHRLFIEQLGDFSYIGYPGEGDRKSTRLNSSHA